MRAARRGPVVDDAEHGSRSGPLGLDHAWSTLSLPGDSPATTSGCFSAFGSWDAEFRKLSALPLGYVRWIRTEGFEPSIPVFAIAWDPRDMLRTRSRRRSRHDRPGARTDAGLAWMQAATKEETDKGSCVDRQCLSRKCVKRAAVDRPPAAPWPVRSRAYERLHDMLRGVEVARARLPEVDRADVSAGAIGQGNEAKALSTRRERRGLSGDRRRRPAQVFCLLTRQMGLLR